MATRKRKTTTAAPEGTEPEGTERSSLSLDIVETRRMRATFHILGAQPLFPRTIKNSLKDLLVGSKKKNAAAKAATQKHDVLREFRESAIVLPDGAPTLLAMPGGSFRKALAQAAVDLPGDANRQMVGRLTFVEEYNIPIYGVPYLHMTGVRQAGINRTPDVRTRVIMPQWAAEITISYQMPMLSFRNVSMLFQAAGMIVGVGDWRQEKGSGSNGLWTIVDADNPEYLFVRESGGRAVQEAAMKDPTCYDTATDELFAWWIEQSKKGNA